MNQPTSQPSSISLRFYAPGEVEVERNGAIISRTSQPGTLFGEMSVLLDRPHSASVRAVDAVEAYVVADPLAVLEQRPAWTLQLARLLAQRLATTTAALVAAREEDGLPEQLVIPDYIMAEMGDPQL